MSDYASAIETEWNLEAARNELVVQICRCEDLISGLRGRLGDNLKEPLELSVPGPADSPAPVGVSEAARFMNAMANRNRIVANKIEYLLNNLDI